MFVLGLFVDSHVNALCNMWMTSLRLVFIFTVFYIAVLAVGTWVNFVLIEPPKDLPNMVLRLAPLQAILLLLCVCYVPRIGGWRSIGFGKFNVLGLFWILPSVAVIIAMVLGMQSAAGPALSAVPVYGVVAIFTVPVLIGLSEEILFRGILFHTLLRKLSFVQAMMMSSVMFALMHSPTLLTGQMAATTFQQMGFAFLVGMFLAPITLRSGTLWVPIIWHAVWDMTIYVGNLSGVYFHYALIGIMIQALFGLILATRIMGRKTLYLRRS